MTRLRTGRPFPPLEGERVGRGGIYLHALRRAPREGGDPDICFQAVCRGLGPRLRGERGMGGQTRPSSALWVISPKGGRFRTQRSSPFGGSTGVAGVGGLIHCPLHRVPYEGGDPDICFQAVCRGLGPRLRGERGMGGQTRPSSALWVISPKGGRFRTQRSSPFGGSTGVAGVGGLIHRPVRCLSWESGRGGAVLPI